MLKILKRVVNAFLILYTFNFFAPATFFIPINIVNLIVITMFKLPAIFFLIIIKLYL